jgi:hypothetical protein
MPDLGVHDARSRCSRCADLSVHDAPIPVFTIGRFPHSGLSRVSLERHEPVYAQMSARSNQRTDHVGWRGHSPPGRRAQIAVPTRRLPRLRQPPTRQAHGAPANARGLHNGTSLSCAGRAQRDPRLLQALVGRRPPPRRRGAVAVHVLRCRASNASASEDAMASRARTAAREGVASSSNHAESIGSWSVSRVAI